MSKSKEIRLAVRRKDRVDPLTWRVRSLGSGVNVLEAKELGNPATYHIYSYRFDPLRFDLKTARQYLASAGIDEVRIRISGSQMMQNLGQKLRIILDNG